MNIKFHLITVSLFVLLIFGAVMLFSSDTFKGSDPVSIAEDRFIQIKSATWGKNCNAYLQTLHDEARKNQAADAPPPLIRNDNALRLVSSFCNAKESCTFTLNETTMGFDPAPTCAKNIEIEYRCFVTDLAHKTTVNQGYSVYINCEKPAE